MRNLGRFTIGGFSYIPENVKLCESPGKAGGLPQGRVTQIDRVLINLLDNSIKYTNPGGTITVSLSNRDKDILVQVADTGIGIPEEHLPHLFNPFYRVTGDSKGSGLGLAIVKTILETNGGRIWVNSIYGKGSTFAFTLPKYLGEINEGA